MGFFRFVCHWLMMLYMYTPKIAANSRREFNSHSYMLASSPALRRQVVQKLGDVNVFLPGLARLTPTLRLGTEL